MFICIVMDVFLLNIYFIIPSDFSSILQAGFLWFSSVLLLKSSLPTRPNHSLFPFFSSPNIVRNGYLLELQLFQVFAVLVSLCSYLWQGLNLRRSKKEVDEMWERERELSHVITWSLAGVMVAGGEAVVFTWLLIMVNKEEACWSKVSSAEAWESFILPAVFAASCGNFLVCLSSFVISEARK